MLLLTNTRQTCLLSLLLQPLSGLPQISLPGQDVRDIFLSGGTSARSVMMMTMTIILATMTMVMTMTIIVTKVTMVTTMTLTLMMKMTTTIVTMMTMMITTMTLMMMMMTN